MKKKIKPTLMQIGNVRANIYYLNQRHIVKPTNFEFIGFNTHKDELNHYLTADFIATDTVEYSTIYNLYQIVIDNLDKSYVAKLLAAIKTGSNIIDDYKFSDEDIDKLFELNLIDKTNNNDYFVINHNLIFRGDIKEFVWCYINLYGNKTEEEIAERDAKAVAVINNAIETYDNNAINDIKDIIIEYCDNLDDAGVYAYDVIRKLNKTNAK